MKIVKCKNCLYYQKCYDGKSAIEPYYKMTAAALEEQIKFVNKCEIYEPKPPNIFDLLKAVLK